MIRALIWKEWREQRWRLVFGCVLLMGTTAIGLRAHMIEDVAVLILATMILGGLFLPILAAIEAIGTNREEGSVPFIAALPARSRVVFSVKACVALATVLVPIAGALVVALAMAGGRDVTGTETVFIVSLGAWIGSNLVIWTMAFGATQPTEARVGVVGIAILAAWFVHINAVTTLTRGHVIARRLIGSPNPLSSFETAEHLVMPNPDHLVIRMLVAQVLLQVTILIMLWLWAARRVSTSGRTHS